MILSIFLNVVGINFDETDWVHVFVASDDFISLYQNHLCHNIIALPPRCLVRSPRINRHPWLAMVNDCHPRN